MNHTTSGKKRLAKALLCLPLMVGLFSVGTVLTGCQGPEAQSVNPPDTSGAPPGGGDPKEYEKNMQRIKAEQMSGKGGAGGTAAPGGAPAGGAPAGGAPAGK